jgi:hypothetical protein
VSAVLNPAAKIAALEVAAEHNKPGMAPHTLFFPDATEAFLTFTFPHKSWRRGYLVDAYEPDPRFELVEPHTAADDGRYDLGV